MKLTIQILGMLVLQLSAVLASAQAPHLQSLGVHDIRWAAPKAQRPAGFPLLFVENRDRYEDGVRYHVEHENGVILLTDTGIVFRDHGREDIVLAFPESNPATHVHAESRSPTVVHYLIGKEDAWRTDVPTFRRVRYANLWPGIDLVLRGDPGIVKYEFRVAPGADAGQIRMRYAGAQLALDTAGHLEVRDAEGLRRTDPEPLAIQFADGEEQPVAAAFALDVRNRDTVGFSVGAYDRSRPLVIDPAFLAYSGYLPPGMGPYGIAVDANGAAVVAGTYFRSLSISDGCIVRIRPDGTGFDFVTYFGGPGKSSGAGGIAVDSSGIYVGGGTYADEKSFPVKVGPDLTYNGGCDTFICKLALDGKTILYCGYVGGSAMDGVDLVAVDSTGAAWLAGRTWSGDYPVKGGPQLTMPGPEPACVAKVAPDGRSLVVSGYIGGSFPGPHFCMGLAVDTRGDAYVTGLTTSDAKTFSFPVKVGPQLVYGGGSADTFIAKIDGRTGGFVYCGFIGGANYDNPWSVAVDAQGAAYVSGQTYSDETTFPVVGGPLSKYTSSYRGDGFLAKVSPGGTGFVYSGFLGGAVGQGIAVDAQRRCYVGGNIPVITPSFPVGGALSARPQGAIDGILMRISADGRTFEYAGYLGGTQTDSISALALGPHDTVHVTGVTLSNGTFPLKIGPSFTYNPPSFPGPYGSFVAKIAEASILASGTGRIGTPVTLTLQANDDPGFAYQVGTSLGTGPIPIDTRTLNLSLDGLLFVSTSGFWPGIFSGYRGVIDSKGQAQAATHIPNVSALIGVRLHSAFVTLDPAAPSGVRSISNTDSFTIAK